MTPAQFYPIQEEFPDDILCPLCRNQKKCDQLGEKGCRAVLAMIKDMKEEPGGFLK